MGILLSFPLNVKANDISLEAIVDRKTVELGSFFQLTLRVNGTQAISPIKLPLMEGFQARYLGPTTSISIVDDKYSKSISFMYNVYPEAIGTFQIPTISLLIDEEIYKTDPITIKVIELGKKPRQSTKASLNDKIFVTMDTPKRVVYLNERMLLTIKMFVNNVSVKDIQYPDFVHIGFAKDEYQEPKRYRQIVDGLPYEIIEFKTYIYPTRVGELTISPAKLMCNIVFRKSRNYKSSFDDFGSVFDESFFDGFFNTYDVRSLTLESEPIDVTVIDLPGKNKPEFFSGAVGEFKFEVTVSPREVKVGDPVTVRMAISGDGNLKALSMPSFIQQGADQTNFKYYDPQVSEDGGVKILEQVIIPTTDQVKELPNITFSYFDVKNETYQSISQGPFPLKVSRLETQEEFKIVGLEQEPTNQIVKEEKIGRDISFIKNDPGGLRVVGYKFYKSMTYLFMVLISICAWIIICYILYFNHKLKTDIRFARRLKAPRYAKKGLLAAKRFMKSGNQKDFYDTLFKTLQSYFSNKFHLPVGTITIEGINNIIKSHAKCKTIISHITAVFKECEFVRYASAELNKDKMKVNFKRTVEIIDFFERSWK